MHSRLYAVSVCRAIQIEIWHQLSSTSAHIYVPRSLTAEFRQRLDVIGAKYQLHIADVQRCDRVVRGVADLSAPISRCSLRSIWFSHLISPGNTAWLVGSNLAFISHAHIISPSLYRNHIAALLIIILSRVRMRSYAESDICLHVCLSVCLSHSGIVSKQRNISSKFRNHLIVSIVLITNRWYDIPMILRYINFRYLSIYLSI